MLHVLRKTICIHLTLLCIYVRDDALVEMSLQT